MAQPKKIDSLIESDEEDFGFGREWIKSDKDMQSDGFRTGLETSQEQALQTGFNAAFKEALQMALAGGKLQGAICASLSCSPNEVLRAKLSSNTQKSFDQSPGVFVPEAGGRQLQTSSLQTLLSANTELISKIPNLLSNEVIKSISKKLGDTTSLQGCSTSSVSETNKQRDDTLMQSDTVVNKESQCTSLSKTPRASPGESQTEEQKDVLSCDNVCNNKSEFWTHLENFRSQAQSLGVVTAREGD